MSKKKQKREVLSLCLNKLEAELLSQIVLELRSQGEDLSLHEIGRAVFRKGLQDYLQSRSNDQSHREFLQELLKLRSFRGSESLLEKLIGGTR